MARAFRKGIISTDLGAPTWCVSDPDGGPDCGIYLGMGDGKVIYAGEISSRRRAEIDAPELGDDGGWWLMNQDWLPIARFASSEHALAFVESIAGAIKRARTEAIDDALSSETRDAARGTGAEGGAS